MRKRRKDRLRGKESRASRSMIGDFMSYISAKNEIKNSRKYPIYECLINPSWEEEGLGRILISRQQSDGRILFGAYLVDVFCLGLKNTFCNANLSLSEYRNEIKARMYSDKDPIDCPIPLAHKIIYGAIDYAANLGFRPQKGFKISKFVLEEPGSVEENAEVEFGRDGKPFYIAGPDDNVERIFRTLERKLGPENFDFLFEA